jgi:hypothetical protein
MGEEFAAQVTKNVYNSYTDRPAMLRLAGDVGGLRVLDLGCGAGHYAAELLERGASTVVGGDGSESLLRAARERLGDGDRAPLHRHDLEEPLAFLPDESFDLAVSSGNCSAPGTCWRSWWSRGPRRRGGRSTPAGTTGATGRRPSSRSASAGPDRSARPAPRPTSSGRP